jgi:hypothetical protein
LVEQNPSAGDEQEAKRGRLLPVWGRAFTKTFFAEMFEKVLTGLAPVMYHQ